ncbi:hypothetical protein MPNT_30061 [Candidatus Methylacidithermus pantelleriae]|uniref:Uncharacterized protein n=1 Tax=Candidatus Methylacidithermus pantelleriae TaxID=2744239 RepID=A0A8J2FWF9_9BACT|nr:hypothetical protein MPNT_30061 [Candidatus Methylacidithermus pantelleriae]
MRVVRANRNAALVAGRAACDGLKGIFRRIDRELGVPWIASETGEPAFEGRSGTPAFFGGPAEACLCLEGWEWSRLTLGCGNAKGERL